MRPPPKHAYSYRAHHALNKYHAMHDTVLSGLPELSRMLEVVKPPPPTAENPICIVGAGIAGLYTAMIFDDLEIPYEILEADLTRVGGRMFTHYFGAPDGSDYQYYVSRIPTIGTTTLISRYRMSVLCVSRTPLSCGERMTLPRG